MNVKQEALIFSFYFQKVMLIIKSLDRTDRAGANFYSFRYEP